MFRFSEKFGEPFWRKQSAPKSVLFVLDHEDFRAEAEALRLEALEEEVY
jgi:hypothetical protein